MSDTKNDTLEALGAIFMLLLVVGALCLVIQLIDWNYRAANNSEEILDLLRSEQETISEQNFQPEETDAR